ncbi:head-tail joining protein [Halodesulfovibrio aestuarii]|uniref:head-tail joining protein n=1 Tax=Halodesulfovibrio aestuarii TaxID=126333 RepID=UPI003D34E7B2
MQEDFTDFLDLDEFAVEVSREDGTTFAAIFDNEGEVGTIGGAVLETTNPMLLCRDVDVSEMVWDRSVVSVPQVGDFVVRSIKPDGTGFATVELGYAN